LCRGSLGCAGQFLVEAEQAEVVVDSPVRPHDLAATIYQALGIPLNTWYRAQDGRPIELVPTGRPVRQLLA